MINPPNFTRTSLRNTMRIQLRWHHHARHGWEEKARECKHWSESYEECCAESHRNAATKSSYCTTTVLQGKPLHGKRYQTILQDSPLPFKAPDWPVRLECHRTEIWLGCKIIRKASLTVVAFQLCDSPRRLCRTTWLYSRLSAFKVQLLTKKKCRRSAINKKNPIRFNIRIGLKMTMRIIFFLVDQNFAISQECSSSLVKKILETITAVYWLHVVLE